MFNSSFIVKRLLYINLIVFLLQLLTGGAGGYITGFFALWGFDYGFKVYQLITYQFIHGGFIHILFNMLALVSIGPSVEDYIGPKKFLIYYLIAGIGSGLLHTCLTNENIPVVGASGSIFAVVVMFAAIYPNEKMILFFIPIGIKAKYLVTTLVLFEIYSAFFTQNNDGISHLGHVGGAICGCIFSIYELIFKKYIKL